MSLLCYSCKIRDLKSTYSLKTYNIRRLGSKQFETRLFFPLPLFYSLLSAANDGSPQKPDSNTRPFHVGRGVNKVTLFLRILRSSRQYHSTAAPYSYSHYYRGYVISGLHSVVKWHGRRRIFTDVISLYIYIHTYIHKAILSQYSGIVTYSRDTPDGFSCYTVTK